MAKHDFHVPGIISNTIRGGYGYESPPGERGVHELFNASSTDAIHNSQARFSPPRCYPDTRTDVLKEINDWKNKADEKILWISGLAGTGKTAIAQTIAETCARDSTLAASFFFFSGDCEFQDQDTATNLFLTIAYQLTIKIPGNRAQIGKTIEQDPSILRAPLLMQIQQLIIPLFIPIHSNGMSTIRLSPRISPPLFIIIDSLDECEGEDDQCNVIQLLGKLAGTHGVPLRFIIVSRPEPHIQNSLDRLDCAIHRISLSSPQHIHQSKNDIHIYLRKAFDEMYWKHGIAKESWPTDSVISDLVQKCGGIFLYASTVLKYVGDGVLHPIQRLKEIMESTDTFPSLALDYLYRQILDNPGTTVLTLHVLKIILLCCQDPHILGTPRIVVLDDIEKLLQVEKGAVRSALRHMHSILDTKNMTFYHPSFLDFIFDAERAGPYFIDVERDHAFIARILLKYISSHTDRDNVFQYATWYWNWHCWKSGRSDWNPTLLETILETLNYHESGLVRPIDSSGVARCLQWFNVDDIQPLNPRYHPVEIQYQLFRAFWKRNLPSLSSPVRIFTFYDPDHLMKDSFEHPVRWMFARYFRCQDHKISGEHWQCYTFCENPKPLPGVLSWGHHFQDVLDPLVKRLLQEPGYNINIVDGHVEVVCRALEIFSKSYPFFEREPNEYAYARKYWATHLSHVPPRNPRIIDSLKRLDYSKLCHPFRITKNDIQGAVEAWLKVSTNQ